MSRYILSGIAAVVALVAAGCGGVGGRSGPPVVDYVDRVELILTSPVAMNWDQHPDPDGVSVRLYFYQVRGRDVRAVTGTGRLDVLLFDGELAPEAILTTRPLHSWVFPGEQLRRSLTADAYGLWSHGLTLPWGRSIPQAPEATVVARYKAPDGPYVYSSPATVLMRAR